MTFARMRLGLALVLFFTWMGWLSYLVLMARSEATAVLSQPQFLVSSLDVVATVSSLDGKDSDITINSVLWPKNKEKYDGKKITIQNLDHCEGWVAPGQYLVPLVELPSNSFDVAATPRSPGYAGPGKPRIYPATEATLKQYAAIPKAEVLGGR